MAATLHTGSWSLSVDDSGVHFSCGRRRPKDLSWDHVTKVRYGPTPVQIDRCGVELADGPQIEGRHSTSAVQVDTVRFRISADDVDH